MMCGPLSGVEASGWTDLMASGHFLNSAHAAGEPTSVTICSIQCSTKWAITGSLDQLDAFDLCVAGCPSQAIGLTHVAQCSLGSILSFGESWCSSVGILL